MTSFPTDLARRIAERLADDDPDLPALTERVLVEGPKPAATARSFDPGTTIALAALLVSAAQFAWGVHRDLKQDRRQAAKDEDAEVRRELLLRRLRLKMDASPGVSPAQRDRVFDVVVEEVLAGGGDG